MRALSNSISQLSCSWSFCYLRRVMHPATPLIRSLNEAFLLFAMRSVINYITQINMATILPKELTKNKEKQGFVAVGRTLPREIIKWIQGLDLSYSVKDPKKDLSNGFLIAEIFSRYYPGRISMHSFDNSHNTSRKINNYDQLELFFKKNEVPFSRDSFQRIVDDNEWDQLYNFIVQIYMFLTQRKVVNPPLATFVQSKDYHSTITEGETQTYLLKEKGLERLDNLKEELKGGDELKDQLSEKQAQLSVSSKRTNFFRVPSKPISQNVENLHYQIEVKNYQIRPVQGSIMKVRDQQNQQQNEEAATNNFGLVQKQVQQDSFHKTMQETQNEKKESKDKQLEKTIYEILNETLMMRLQQPQFSEDMKRMRVKNSTLVQAFSDQIELFSDEFTMGFFNEIIQQKEAFINFIFKDTNDLWKFFNFAFQCLGNLTTDREPFGVCVELIQQFGMKALQKDQNKTRYIFTEFFLPQICQLIKGSIVFEKKELIIQLIYAFCPPDPIIRHQIIAAIKEQINSTELFMQTLVVLVRYETTYSDVAKMLFEDYIKFAYTYLFSQSPALSSCALMVLAHIAEVHPPIVHQKLYNKVNAIARNKWWQNRCIAVRLFAALMKGVINTPQYQALIKAPQQGQKFFSMENDRLISDLKAQVNHFANAILTAAYPTSSDVLLSTTLIYIVDLLGDSKILLDLFTRIMIEAGPELRQWVLYGGIQEQQEDQQQQDNYVYIIPSDKTFKYKTNINSNVIQQFASSILVHLIDLFKQQKPLALTNSQFQLLHYCFAFTDFKVMNMESCEQVANIAKIYIYLGMSDQEVCQEAAELIRKLLDLQYKGEVNITEQEQLLVQCINLIIQSENKVCIENLIKFLNLAIEESHNSGNEGLRMHLKQVNQILQETNSVALNNQSISRALDRLGSNIEESHFAPSNFGSAIHQQPNLNNIPSQIDEDIEISAVDQQQESMDADADGEFVDGMEEQQEEGEQYNEEGEQ